MPDFADPKAVIKAMDSGTPRSQAIAVHAIELIGQGKLKEANTALNAALKLDISNQFLHHLNGLAYHLRYLQGEQDKYELARVGYLTAIGQDGALVEAFIQLGRLFLSAKEFALAKQVFSDAASIAPDNASALYGMAHAAFFEGDTKTVVYSVDRLKALKWDDPLLLRLEAALLAISGRENEALETYRQYEARVGDARDGQFMRRRLRTFASLSAADAETRNSPAAGKLLLAQAASPDPAKPKAAEAADTKAEPESKAWFRCDTTPAIPLQKDLAPAIAVAATDETLVPSVLPKPCDGERIPLAIVEVTMIRTEETEARGLGVNLLEGLTGVFRSVMTRSREPDTRTFRRERAYGFAQGDDAGQYLSYSLNIANSAFAKNEVIARPALAVIDRVPAVFFSGATITLGVAGAGGGASTVVDKPVGVSLAVTPTFVDDDSILLSIRATRSFIENGLTAGSSVLLQQTRNMVNASALLKYGESFVLSGLVEREIDGSDSGVPVLGEIPILQYLFKRDERLDFRRQILTLVTVRKIVPGDASNERRNAISKPGEISSHKLAGKIEEFFRLQKSRPVIDELLELLPKDNSIYRRMMERDVIQESWTNRNRLDLILKELKDSLYY
jgi:tetratricopeptide (TPR) repeat protein